MTPLTVALPLDDQRSAATHRAILAGMPSRFRVSDASFCDVRLVSGSTPLWMDRVRAAIADGVRAVLLTRPHAVDVAQIQELGARADADGVIVAVDNPHTSDPAWTAALPRIQKAAAQATIVDSVVVVPPRGSADQALTNALIGQLALVRLLLGEYQFHAAVPPSDSHYVVVNDAGRSVVTLAGVISVTGEERLDVDVIETQRRWSVRFEDCGLAWPTQITLFDANGQHTVRPRYESGHRRSWIALHAAVENGTPPACSLDDVVIDVSHAAMIRAANHSSRMDVTRPGMHRL